MSKSSEQYEEAKALRDEQAAQRNGCLSRISLAKTNLKNASEKRGNHLASLYRSGRFSSLIKEEYEKKSRSNRTDEDDDRVEALLISGLQNTAASDPKQRGWIQAELDELESNRKELDDCKSALAAAKAAFEEASSSFEEADASFNAIVQQSLAALKEVEEHAAAEVARAERKIEATKDRFTKRKQRLGEIDTGALRAAVEMATGRDATSKKRALAEALAEVEAITVANTADTSLLEGLERVLSKAKAEHARAEESHREACELACDQKRYAIHDELIALLGDDGPVADVMRRLATATEDARDAALWNSPGANLMIPELRIELPWINQHSEYPRSIYLPAAE